MMKLKKRFKLKLVKLKDIKFDKSNPNRMSDIKKAGLKKSIDTFGYVDEIVIDKNTKIVANGEHRLRELLDNGETEAEVKVFNFKNEAERRLYRQIANKLSGEHDPQLDKEEFKFLDENDILTDLAEMLGEDEIDFVYDEEEELPELEKNELDVTLTREVKCPKCQHKFEIKKKE